MSFKVKALFPYSSEHDDDLSFPEGQIITVTEEEDDDWYTGEYTDEASGKHHQGLFPRNFVERYEPVAPPRPARRPQAAAPVPQPEPVAEPEDEPEPEPVPAPDPKSPVTQTKSPDPVSAELDEHEEEEESEEEEEEAAPPPTLATKPPPPPREEPQQPVPAPAPRAVPPPVAPAATKPLPPPAASADSTTKQDVADKPISSFRDRIAAFNRGGAAPFAPPKPGGFSGGSGSSGFIKKPYVAPPPSRNAYVPPATQAPVARIYRREEDPELNAQDDGERAPPPPPPEKSEEPEEDQPKPMSLKERMAMLQKQQLEQQARHAEAASKKAKPKPPPKKTSASSQPPIPSASPEAASEVGDSLPPTRVLSNDSTRPETITSPEHEVDEPVAMQDDESEDLPRAAAPPRVPTSINPHKPAADEVEEEEDGEKEEADKEAEGEEEGEEEEMDPEIRRRMEIRERMAKMSGGMGMGAMFGGGPGLPGMGARKPPKSRPSDPSAESEEVAESRPAPPVPIMPGMAMPGMALPGMGMPRPPKKQDTSDALEVEQEDDEPEPGSISAKAAAEVSDVEDLKDQPESEEEREKKPERVLPPPPEVRQAPPVPPTAERSQRASVASSGSTAAERPQFVPPIPQRAPEHTSERAPPPPPPSQVTSPPLPPTSPPRRSTDSKRMSQGPDGASGYSRAPPPPPPSQPPRQSMEASRPDESDEEEEEDESEEDEPAGRQSHELHHAGLPSLGPGSQTRAPPPPPPGQASAPRGVPPPPPSQPPRHSVELPRAPPPVPLPARSPPQDEDYDPYNYTSNPMGVPTPSGSTANTPRVEIQHDDLYDSDPPASSSVRAPPPIPSQAPPAQAAPPVPPPSQPPPSQAAPPPPPPAAAPQIISPQSPPQVPPQAPPPQMPSGMSPLAPQDSRKSIDVLNRSATRRSMDVSRPSGDNYEYIASDIDLGRDSNWWAHRRSPPPALQNRGDVSIEYDESNTVQSDGRPLTAKHVYALFMDYSQTVVTAYFSPENPSGGVEFQQRHEPPPAQLRQDQLEAAHDQFGTQIAQTAKSKENHAVADGSAFAFVAELIKALPSALMPVGNRAFGALVYANMANTTITSHDEIRGGDVLTFRKAKLQGHRGGLKQKYSVELASHVGIVLDWDGTKHKVRVYEQNGKKVKVESYKLDDLKTGEAKVWRVVGREWVGWGATS